ncbi:MAG TPA: hypothetical protein ENN42_06485 [Thioalkalivibrio sp.]|nr:hypothetical protein [Thioalkalivibrio sp.]
MKLHLSILGLVAVGTVAMADVPMTFEELDRNADGYISAEEAAARPDLAKKWDKADTDGDGRLTIGEYQAWAGKGRMSPPEETETPEPGAAPYR